MTAAAALLQRPWGRVRVRQRGRVKVCLLIY